jgi:hypothetical protein
MKMFNSIHWVGWGGAGYGRARWVRWGNMISIKAKYKETRSDPPRQTPNVTKDTTHSAGMIPITKNNSYQPTIVIGTTRRGHPLLGFLIRIRPPTHEHQQTHGNKTLKDSNKVPLATQMSSKMSCRAFLLMVLVLF